MTDLQRLIAERDRIRRLSDDFKLAWLQGRLDRLLVISGCKVAMPLVRVRRAPAPAPSAIASSLNCPLCVTRNAAILGRFVFCGRDCRRQRGRSFYRRIIGADLGQRICNTSRLDNLRIRAGFVYGYTQAIIGP